MKLLQDSEDAKAEKKSLKPQVERRRRERMNRSLESLKTLLLQRQEANKRRVEKAEILEHTVLFLQSTAEGDKTRAGGGGGCGGQRHSFQDGFSTCLQRAAQFLGPEGKGLWLGSALDASFAARFSRSDSDSAQRRTEARPSSSSVLLRKSSRSILRLLINRSGYRRCTPALTAATCVQTSHRQSTAPPQPHRAASRASKQSPTHGQAVCQSLWRPWP
ncbi:transcription factor HES-5-like [Centropristis striata]|uniref:transcription factor HES-5-like n=1 Tax=Centropristis striata TaxID=184440 RepID=UPI0027DF27C8|nr:transcription factor HES-5-like [Centropristis striata]